jgi:hypothetical protein
LAKTIKEHHASLEREVKLLASRIERRTGLRAADAERSQGVEAADQGTFDNDGDIEPVVGQTPEPALALLADPSATLAVTTAALSRMIRERQHPLWAPPAPDTSFNLLIRQVMHAAADGPAPSLDASVLLERDVVAYVRRVLVAMRSALGRQAVRASDFAGAMPDTTQVFFRWKLLRSMSASSEGGAAAAADSAAAAEAAGSRGAVGAEGPEEEEDNLIDVELDDGDVDLGGLEGAAADEAATVAGTKSVCAGGVETRDTRTVPDAAPLQDLAGAAAAEPMCTADPTVPCTRAADLAESFPCSALAGRSTEALQTTASGAKRSRRAGSVFGAPASADEAPADKAAGGGKRQRRGTASNIQPSTAGTAGAGSERVASDEAERESLGTPGSARPRAGSALDVSPAPAMSPLNAAGCGVGGAEDEDEEEEAERLRMRLLEAAAEEDFRSGGDAARSGGAKSAWQSVISSTRRGALEPLSEALSAAGAAASGAASAATSAGGVSSDACAAGAESDSSAATPAPARSLPTTHVWRAFQQRLDFASARSSAMTTLQYAIYARSREAGFTGTPTLKRAFARLLPPPALPDAALEVLAYIAYDRVAHVVEEANRIAYATPSGASAAAAEGAGTAIIGRASAAAAEGDGTATIGGASAAGSAAPSPVLMDAAAVASSCSSGATVTRSCACSAGSNDVVAPACSLGPLTHSMGSIPYLAYQAALARQHPLPAELHNLFLAAAAQARGARIDARDPLHRVATSVAGAGSAASAMSAAATRVPRAGVASVRSALAAPGQPDFRHGAAFDSLALSTSTSGLRPTEDRGAEADRVPSARGASRLRSFAPAAPLQAAPHRRRRGQA